MEKRQLADLGQKITKAIVTVQHMLQGREFVPVSMLQSVRFMDTAKKRKVLSHWEHFVKSGFRGSAFTKDVYEHLHLHCSFIAHYNRDGFYGTYWDADMENPDPFREILKFYNFESFMRQFNLWSDDYIDINTNMLHIVLRYFLTRKMEINDEVIRLYRGDIESSYTLYSEERARLRAEIESLRGQIIELTTQMDDMDEESFVVEMVAKYRGLFPEVNFTTYLPPAANM